MTSTLSAILTGVIAFANVAYVVISVLLWRATKRSADAAKNSADAARHIAEGAKKAAELNAALHRPYLGVPLLTLHNRYDAEKWAIRWEVKNFGTLPARNVTIHVQLNRNGKPFGNPVVRGPCEILPQSSVESFLADVPVDRETRDKLQRDDWSLAAEVRVEYAVPSGPSYLHAAVFVYDRKEQNFRPERSETLDVHP